MEKRKKSVRRLAEKTKEMMNLVQGGDRGKKRSQWTLESFRKEN